MNKKITYICRTTIPCRSANSIHVMKMCDALSQLGHKVSLLTDYIIAKKMNVTKVSFKKVLVGVGYAHAPGLVRFFAVTPEFVIPIVFFTQFWIFASLIVSTKQILNLKSNIKSFGIVFLSFLIIAFLSVSFVMSRMNALPINNIS